MKRKIAILLSLIIIFASISGCSSKGSTTSNNKAKILFTISSTSDKFLGTLAAGAEDYAKSQNIDLTLKDAAGSIEKQVADIKEAASNGYNVIICQIVNPDTGLQIKRAAGEIPIIFINSVPTGDILEKNKYIYVGSDEMTSGKYQGEYIADYLKNKKDTKIVILKGEKSHMAAKNRTKSAKAVFEERGVNADYVFEDNADWSRKNAEDMFDVFLSTNKKFDAVICNNDEMALGVINSLKAHNIDPSTIPVVGVDGTADGCKAIIDGSMKFTVYQSAKGQGKSSVEAAVQMASGKDISKIEYADADGTHIWVPFEKVDKSNVSKYSE